MGRTTEQDQIIHMTTTYEGVESWRRFGVLCRCGWVIGAVFGTRGEARTAGDRHLAEENRGER